MDNNNFTFGFDIGITSIGWAVINRDLNRIEDLGVRKFPVGEDPYKGTSLALPRRLARGQRRLLRRKAYRVNRVRKLIISNKILSDNELSNLFISNNTPSVWQSRVDGLTRKLSNIEWSKVLINLCKRRGFKSNRKKEINDKQTGVIIRNINENEKAMKEKGYKTIGEYIYKNSQIGTDNYRNLRNKGGSYLNCISRKSIRDEITILFKIQRDFNNEYASEEIEQEYLKIFDSQRPYSNFKQLESLIGKCTFEKNEIRSPKSSIAAEEFRLYDNLNKICIITDGKKRSLTDIERDLIVKEAFAKKEIKYTSLRKLLQLDNSSFFSGLTYSTDKDISKTEKSIFVSLSGYYELKKTISSNSKELWNNVKDNRYILNQLSYVLTVGKTDSEIKKELQKRNISNEIIENVLDISFSKFTNLSIKALENILPFMKKGYQYNEACLKAGYDFKNIYKGVKSKKLPLIEVDEIVNPVVLRALTQTRKVLNALIDKYGSPVSINIELARELSKNKSERNKIKKLQLQNREINDVLRDELEQLLNKKPTGSELQKYKLWKLQDGVCAYTNMNIDLFRLFNAGYTEIDHIIPFSRCFDDRLTNKVLVMAVENQNKANRTPFEYFGHDKDRWNLFKNWVNESNLPYKKKQNLLNASFDEITSNEWKQRNLQDTQYICKYLANFIEHRLIFKDTTKIKKVLTINGIATSILRNKWGINKVRDEGEKHHALDAVIIAVADFKMINRITRYSKAHETKYKHINETYIDIETKETLNHDVLSNDRKSLFPRPWKEFNEELQGRLSDNPVEYFKLNKIDSYDSNFIKNLKPILISKMPIRKAHGKLFGDSLYSNKNYKPVITIIPLTNLKKDHLSNLFEPSKNKLLYNEINERMLKFNNNAKKAFKESLVDPVSNTIIQEVQVVESILYANKTKLENLTRKDLDNFYNYSCDKLLYDAITERMELFNYNAKEAFKDDFRKPTSTGKLGPIVKSVKILDYPHIKDGIDYHKVNGIFKAKVSNAKNSMVKINIYEKNKQLYVIPIYKYHITNKIEPNKVIVAHKLEKDWIPIDESFKFKFSLYKNDFIKIKVNDSIYTGYYIGFDKSGGTITLETHDSSSTNRIAIKNSEIIKYSVDILGNYYLIKEKKKSLIKKSEQLSFF